MKANAGIVDHALLHRRGDHRREFARDAAGDRGVERREHRLRIGGIEPARRRRAPPAGRCATSSAPGVAGARADVGARSARPRRAAAPRSRSSSMSPTSTSRAGQRAFGEPRRTSSGPMPAGSPAVTAIVVDQPSRDSAERARRRYRPRRRRLSTCDVRRCVDRRRRRPATAILACANPSSALRRACRTATARSSGFARSISPVCCTTRPERQRVAFASEHRKAVERRAIADHLPTGKALPATRGRTTRRAAARSRLRRPGAMIGATSSASPHMNCVS